MVTGAPNLNVGDGGQKVILALAGSVLFDGHATPKKLSELKPGKIRGVPSDAMVCSSFELGIDEEHEGIILLEDDAPVGTPLVDFMGDVVLELEVTAEPGPLPVDDRRGPRGGRADRPDAEAAAARRPGDGRADRRPGPASPSKIRNCRPATPRCCSRA